MPTRDDLLREKTHKGQTETLEQRVFYTLHEDSSTQREHLQTHRNTKVIAHLIARLHQQGILSDDAIDEILLDSVSG